MSKERGEKYQPISIENIAYLAKETALEYGGHVPTVIAVGESGPLIGQFPDLPGTHAGRKDLMRQSGYALARSGAVRDLRQVFFISEAWVSAAKQPGEPPIQPSLDPARIEALIVSGLETKTRRSKLILYEMIRDEDGDLSELRRLSDLEEADGQLDSPLLNAFVEGFNAGILGSQN